MGCGKKHTIKYHRGCLEEKYDETAIQKIKDGKCPIANCKGELQSCAMGTKCRQREFTKPVDFVEEDVKTCKKTHIKYHKGCLRVTYDLITKGKCPVSGCGIDLETCELDNCSSTTFQMPVDFVRVECKKLHSYHQECIN